MLNIVQKIANAIPAVESTTNTEVTEMCTDTSSSFGTPSNGNPPRRKKILFEPEELAWSHQLKCIFHKLLCMPHGPALSLAIKSICIPFKK